MRFRKWISIFAALCLLFSLAPTSLAEEGIVVEYELPLVISEDSDEIASSEAVEEAVDEIDDFDLSTLYDDEVYLSEEPDLGMNEVEISSVALANANSDFVIDDDGVLTKYTGFNKNVVIPYGVKEIGSCVFSSDHTMETVFIPSSVTCIDYSAFEYCTNLKSVTIPDSVTETGSYVFDGCTGLTSFKLSSNLTTMSNGLFSGCTGLETINIPGNITSIQGRVFAGCIGLKSITIPGNVKSIGEYAFGGCESLYSVILSNGVTSIDGNAFCYCKSLESITIPSSVTSMVRSAFDGSDNVVIRGNAGSYAETFANGVGIPFNAPIVSFNEETYRCIDEGDDHYGIILYKNQTKSISAVQKPSGLATTLAWSSSNTNVATVDQNGNLKGVGKGTTTITANTANGKGKAAQIKVAVPEPSAIKLRLYSKQVVLGNTEEITASVDTLYSYITDVSFPLSWTSSNNSVLSVESTGDRTATLTGKTPGIGVITATTPDGGSATIEVEVVRPKATDVKIDQADPITLHPGETYALSATVAPAEASYTLTWDASNKNIATVNASGVVTAVSEGNAMIGVFTDNHLSDTIEINVIPLTPHPESISIDQFRDIELFRGETFALTATVSPFDADPSVIWTSSDPSVATISDTGLITAINPGLTRIQAATLNELDRIYSSGIYVYVNSRTPDRVRLNKSKATLGVKEKLGLTATLTPSNSETTLRYFSNNTQVAVVSNSGVITAKKAGKATIAVVTANGRSATIKITVKTAPSKISLNKSGTVTLKKGKKLKLTAKLPSGSASALTWKSSKPKVATVSASGQVVAVGKGTATITVKTFNGKKASVKIKVT